MPETCWIVNRARSTAHVPVPHDDPEVHDPRRIASGDYEEVPGSVDTWKARLKGHAHLEVRARAPREGEDILAAAVLPKPPKQRGSTNRRSREQIDGAA